MQAVPEPAKPEHDKDDDDMGDRAIIPAGKVFKMHVDTLFKRPTKAQKVSP